MWTQNQLYLVTQFLAYVIIRPSQYNENAYKIIIQFKNALEIALFFKLEYHSQMIA